MREQFIIGQPQPRRGGLRQIGRPGGGMHRCHGCAPVRPAFARFQRAIDPLRQIRGALHRRGCSLGDGFLRQTRDQRIDRLIGGKLARFFRAQHMVGMHHLRNAIEQLDPARDQAALTGGQQLLQEIAARMKVDQLKFQPRIPHHHAVRAALGAGRKMRPHLDLDRQRHRGDHVADRGFAAAVHTRSGQQEQQILRALHAQP